MIRFFPHHLTEEFDEYWLDYLILVLGLLGGLGVFVFFSGQSVKQVAIVFSLAFFYFLWGVVHHYLKKDLHFKVVLEYFLISLLGLMVFLSLIKRL